jgi:hypothetical protein
MSRYNIIPQALQRNPQGRRRVERPRNSWRRDLTAVIIVLSQVCSRHIPVTDIFSIMLPRV